jgi:lipoprotein Spr
LRTHDASPDELTYLTVFPHGGRALFWGVCFVVFCFLSIQTVSAQSQAAGAQPPSCEVVKPAQKKANPPPQASTPKKTLPPKVSATAPAKPVPPKASIPAPKSAPGTAKKAPAPAKPGTATAKAKSKPKPQPAPLVSSRTKAKAEAITSELSTDLPSNVEQEISKFFGLRYRFGGEGRSGIDCSALVKQVYSDVFGVSLPRSSTEQSRVGNLEYVPRDDLKTGDLVFFGPNRKTVNHVGMYLSGGHFLHAARSEGVTISRLDDSYWRSRFMFSKRMRGLDTGEDDADDAMDFHRDFMRDSYMAFDREHDSVVGLLEFGIKLNDSLELLLSGFFLNSLADHSPAAGMTMPSSDTSGPESKAEGGGFRLSAVMSPNEWIKLIPSITQAEVRDDRSRDSQKFGLETWMILPSTRLAVFMAAYARNQDDLFDRPLSASPDWQTMDMAVGLHYQLSESLRFSLWGTHIYTPEARVNEETGRRQPLDDVSFQLNIKF